MTFPSGRATFTFEALRHSDTQAGFPGAHTQGRTLDELHANLREVIAMLPEDGEPKLEAEFVGIQTVLVGSQELIGSR